MNFYFYGVTLNIRTSDISLEDLGDDFSYFKSSPIGESEISIELRSEKYLGPTGRRIFSTELCAVHNLGSKRICVYDTETVLVAENERSRRKFVLYSKNAEFSYEILYNLILSSVGEALDTRGYHRVHALGFKSRDRSVLVSLPMGMGKSALATLALRDQDVSLFSDESPLIKNGQIYPFPIRIALNPDVAEALNVTQLGRAFVRKKFATKHLYPIPHERVATQSKLDFLISGSLTDSTPKIVHESRLVAGSTLFRNMTIGLGLAQMREHMIRASAFVRLGKIAASRTREMTRTLTACETFHFKLGRDARENWKILREFISNLQTKSDS